MTLRIRSAVAASAVLLLALTGCANQVEGSAVTEKSGGAKGSANPPAGQPQAPGGLPYGDEAQLNKAFDTMRTWDVCAMHDVQALLGSLEVREAFLHPVLDLSACKLDVETTDLVSWEYEIGLFPAGNRNPDGKPSKEKIGGVELTKIAASGECSYEYPFHKVAIINVMARTFDSEQGSAACQQAKNYVSKVLANLRNPPLASAGRSTPRMRMAGQDPCQGLVPIYRRLHAQGVKDSELWLHQPNPYQCELYGKETHKIHFIVDDPEEYTEGTPVTVAGLRGVSESTSSCTVRFGLDEPVLTEKYDAKQQQGIELGLESCANQAELGQILEPYRDALQAKLPPAQPGAVRLGAQQ